MTGLYIHIPFCPKKCAYCDFNSGYTPSREKLREYIGALKIEMELISRRYPGKITLDTVYYGGGTPSILELEDIRDVMESAARCFPITSRETTIEINPEDVTAEKAGGWLEVGINRASLGFQSMNDGTLAFLGRRNTRMTNLQAYELLRAAGFANISLDLILSVRDDDFQESVGEVLRLRPEHISAYNLSIEPKTKLGVMAAKGIYKPLDDEAYLENYWHTIRELEGAGYLHYEISNLALSRAYFGIHNGNYWDYGGYIGIGAGASGFLQGLDEGEFGFRWTNPNKPEDYIRQMTNGKLFPDGIETIDREMAIREWIMMGLRRKEGIRRESCQRLFGQDLSALLNLDGLKELGRWLSVSVDCLSLTPAGIDVSNTVIGQVWEHIQGV